MNILQPEGLCPVENVGKKKIKEGQSGNRPGISSGKKEKVY